MLTNNIRKINRDIKYYQELYNNINEEFPKCFELEQINNILINLYKYKKSIKEYYKK